MIFKNRRVAVIADLHLGVHQNNTMWHDIAINYAKWLKAILENNDIEDIMFCGDWFHHRDEINVATINVASKILDILSCFNIVMIPGNHDCYLKNEASINSLSIIKGRNNVTVFDKLETHDIFTKSVTFVPWGIPVKDVPRSDVVFGHFELANFQINNFKICDHGEDYKDLLSSSTMTFTGHFHLNQERVFDNGKIIYVGNTFQMDFGDAERSKYVYLYDFIDNTYQRIENDVSPKHFVVKLSELDKFDTKTKETITNNIVRLHVDKKISHEDVDKVSAKISQFKPIGYSVDYKIDVDKIELNANFDTNLKGIDISAMIDEFIDLMEIENKPVVRKYVNDLYKDCIK